MRFTAAATTRDYIPLELLGAVRWQPSREVGVTLGGGPGLVPGYGTPRFRVVASIFWSPSETGQRIARTRRATAESQLASAR